ncbi:MAG TPA: AAA domain-containing protein [Cyclobacteriaceae bacterium]|jgi:superfamily I DNA and/or RNA helicase|nr:AAA domain-containing protein [Cyclobacteriaceae bacterium]
MNSKEQLKHTLQLLQLERQADLEQYRQRVLMRSLHQRTKEGVTWYPIRLVRDYIGTGERVIIEIEKTNSLDLPHSFQSGKVVSLFSNASGKPETQHINGVVNYVRENTMTITINGDDLPDWIDDGSLGVDVMFDEMSYREMEYALKKVMEVEDGRLAELREILLNVDGLKTINGQKESNIQEPAPSLLRPAASVLNESQWKAVQKMTSTTDVAFIHGPPGTGKTTTIVEAIKQTIKEERQVLVCAPSNAAVDLLVEKLSAQGLNTLRIGHPARVTEQTLSKTIDVKISEHNHFGELRALRRKMEQVRRQAGQFKRNFGPHERQQRSLLREEARLLKSDADMLEFYIINDLLNNADAICCTLVGSSHPVLKGRKFKTVFIDEAAQALEPACWIPLLKSHRVIFAGDHCQLPPTIKSKEAASQGLSQTLFEKGIEKFPALTSMLRVQYRMHESIMEFPSKYFYHNGLMAHESVKHELLRPYELPIEFIDTAGCGYTEKQDPETLSRFNQEEAELSIQQIERLVESVGAATWADEKITLGIIAPYRAQVDRLEQLAENSIVLRQLGSLISINTVDAFQGQEREVIAISFVRSNEKSEVGFLMDIRRTNVAMTRAKKKLLMVGDSATLASHSFYADLIEFLQQKGFYKSAYSL